ncbi:MAG: hypothetical protein J6X42_02415 [Alphaproteobacteria bacterium]|nr:hypothetical protein [Alphaproteobacteria bacterium]
MSVLSSSEITELVCTRLNHDLIGNIGSMTNALELLDEDPNDLADVQPILMLGAKTLVARLKFFRLAFGLKNAAPKNIDEMKSIAEKYLETLGTTHKKLNIMWQINNLSLYKIIYLGLMALADVLIKDGEFEVVETGDGLHLTVRSDYALSAEKLKNLKHALDGHIAEDNPALLAPVAYLQSLLGEVGVNVGLDATEKEAVLRLK